MESSDNTGSGSAPTSANTDQFARQVQRLETAIARYERLIADSDESVTDWERIFDAIEDPICIVTADYRVVHANAAYVRLFGPASARGGRHYCFLSGGEDDDDHPEACADCPLPETIRTRCSQFTQQKARFSPDDGEREPAQQSRLHQRWTYPVVDGDGKVYRIVEVVSDITEQEQMRREIAKTEALREADRLKAELLGTVSHELRSPLSAIKGYAATLLRYERRLSREEQRSFLQAIGEASDRLEVIINRLLEMSQLETGSIVPRLAPLDIVEVTREAIAVAERRARANAPGKYTFSMRLLASGGSPDHALPLIEADHRLLRDTLDNLLENAVKYSPDGGSVDVTLSVRAAPGAPAADTPAEAPEMVEIVVRDTGLGIPVEHLGRVFERFHRVDTRLTREVDGLGLGLAMCKRIADLHGGSIWAESAPGQGSAFHLTLPIGGAAHDDLSDDLDDGLGAARDSALTSAS